MAFSVSEDSSSSGRGFSQHEDLSSDAGVMEDVARPIFKSSRTFKVSTKRRLRAAKTGLSAAGRNDASNFCHLAHTTTEKFPDSPKKETDSL